MLGNVGLKLVEAELSKHCPEIQSFILSQLKVLAEDIIDFVMQKGKEMEEGKQ